MLRELMVIRFAAMVAGVGMALTCYGSTLTFRQQTGNSHATATFTLLGNGNLQVTLANTSIGAASSDNDILTAVFFAAPGINLIPVSVVLSGGSSLLNCSGCGSSTNLGGAWAYTATAGGLVYGQTVHLAGAAALPVFQGSGLFGGPELSGMGNLMGADFGLASVATAIPGAAAFTGSPLVSNQVTMTFSSQSPLNLPAIGTVGFVYGNAWYSAGRYFLETETPEPASSLLIGAGLIGVALVRRRRQEGA